ncbi:MAG: hypothetical protein JRH18_24285, partial [Deltaproteobacteria bacterium]|nr:hypothetical protein [Deltaproteobacteria bacterium]
NSKAYEKGVKVSNNHFKEISIKRHEILPNWNYTITPN